jgi:hypothetical protein
MRFVSAVALAAVMLWVPVDGVAQENDCPAGTWPRDMYTGPGGGMYTGPGGGMYTGPGGGMYTGPGGGAYTGPGQRYCSNRPPLSWLRENGYMR